MVNKKVNGNLPVEVAKNECSKYSNKIINLKRLKYKLGNKLKTENEAIFERFEGWPGYDEEKSNSLQD